jgi:hypothetical protein
MREPLNPTENNPTSYFSIRGKLVPGLEKPRVI